MEINEAKKGNIIIPIMHCFDDNYVIPAAVSFYSMLENANKDFSYKLYVLHSDITVQNQIKLSQLVNSFSNASIEFINMAHCFNDIWEELQFTGHYSKEVLYKLLISSIFPQYDKMIITDVDVVFLGDISESYFSLDTDEKIYFAGVHQIVPKDSWLEDYYKNYNEHFGKDSIKQLKICGGYLVANLVQLRLRHMEDKFIAFLKQNAYRLLQSEQDVINFCCEKDEIKYLPLNYVVCSYQYSIFNDESKLDSDAFYTREQIIDSMNYPIQLHYATGTKPWKDPGSTKADIWFYYLAKCGLYFDYVKKEQVMHEEAPDYISNSLLRKGNSENRSPMIVSILCCTYNHEKFIRQTLEGLVNQRVDFPFEIIVSDDCSQDSTQDIIREYCVKYPDLIHPILREKNVGIGMNYYDALKHVSGRFLAICDGDDCWIDMLKLKKQVDFLTQNPDYNICCSSCIKYQVNNNEEVLYEPLEYIKSAITEKEAYTFKDLLYCRFIASSTEMIRWQLRDCVPEFLKSYDVIDFTLNLIHAAGGKIKVMNDEVFARYNLHEGGITSSKNDKVEQQTFCIINEVNQYLDYRFSRTVSEYKEALRQYMEWQRKTEKEKSLEDTKTSTAENESDMIEECEKEEAAGGNNVLKEPFSVKILNFFCVIYRECVPEVLKRVWRLFKKALIVIYRECVPNILKRGYRSIKRAVIKGE